MLVELCGKVNQAQGHAETHRWIEMLPQPYQTEMWRVLEELETPVWMPEQNNYASWSGRSDGSNNNQDVSIQTVSQEVYHRLDK